MSRRRAVGAIVLDASFLRGVAVSLRMNLYGWRIPEFLRVIGSQDPAVLKRATSRVTESLSSGPAQSQAIAWLHTLVMKGYPLRWDREQAMEPAEGELLTVQMETEVHALTVYCLARAIAREEHLEFAGESSYWKHSAVGSLYRELEACGFTRSTSCDPLLFSGITSLENGRPLFGDDFRTEWSYYTWFTNSDLSAMISVFQAAVDYRRDIPEGVSEKFAKNGATSISDDAKQFVTDLNDWFQRIQVAGQDAFILWW